MRKINRFKYLSLIGLLVVSSIGFTGCKKEEEKPVYKLTAVTKNNLEDGRFYLKDGSDFYILPKGQNNAGEGEFFSSSYITPQQKVQATPTVDENGEEVPEENVDYDYSYGDEEDERLILFGEDSNCIPTLYSDQVIAYSSSTADEQYSIERCLDLGWSIGMCNFKPLDSGKYQSLAEGQNFYEVCDIRNKINECGQVSAGDALTLDSIAGKSADDKNVQYGVFTGLSRNKSYDTSIYNGTKKLKLGKVKADTHYFKAFEKYTIDNYEFGDGNFITIQFPETFLSGYYYINGIGMVRYIKGNASDGLKEKDVDFSVPYYYTNEETGETYTYDEVSTTEKKDPQSTTSPDGDTEETKSNIKIDNKDGPLYTNVITLDSSSKSIDIAIDYEDAKSVVDNQEVSISDKEVGLPSAKIIDPNGKEYLMKQEDHKLTYKIDGGTIGDYTIELYNCSKRKFSFKTSIETGNSDTLIHTGSGTQSLEYYVKNDLTKGTFTITWENTTHAADVVITSPDGTQYGKSINKKQIVKDEYGELQINVGKVKHGTYTISVDGDDLGRVQVKAAESK